MLGVLFAHVNCEIPLDDQVKSVIYIGDWSSGQNSKLEL